MGEVRDIMTTDVVTVNQRATAEYAIRTLLERDISGAPVVDGDNQLVGIITEFQLLEAIYAPEVKQNFVGDLMTKMVFTVEEHTSLVDVTDKLVFLRIRRIPVVRGRRVVGVVARRDLIRYVIDHGKAPAETRHADTAFSRA